MSTSLLDQLWFFHVVTTVAKFVWLAVLFVLPLAAVLTWMERRQSALSQDRLGPRRASLGFSQRGGVRLWGLVHVLADAIKMFFKEPFIPTQAEKAVFLVAPLIGFVTSLVILAVIPFGPDLHFTTGPALWRHIPLQMLGSDAGLLLVLGLASLGVYGVALAGFSSHNRLALLGGLRAAAQTIAYEVALGLTLVGVMMCFGSIDLHHIVAQGSRPIWGGLPAWGLFLQPGAALLFLVAAIAETKRTPFDLPESESEIVGYFVEYSSMGFGLFMLGEFVEVVVLGCLFTCLFLGGWQLPWLFNEHGVRLGPWLIGLNTWGLALLGFVVFAFKVFLISSLQLQIRWTLPRFRFDQLMRLGWKNLLPLSLLNILITAILMGIDPHLQLLMQWNTMAAVLFVGVVVLGPIKKELNDGHC